MGILGIENRTENWKTAQAFAPFFKDKKRLARLANELETNVLCWNKIDRLANPDSLRYFEEMP